ncbi:MAG: HAD family hydrolase [Thermoprotei archaeon]
MYLSELKAVIFDLDGTLVNTAFLHKDAWELALKELCIETKVDVTHLLGRRSADIAKILAGDRWKELLEVKNRIFLKLVEEKAEPLPCAKDVLEFLRLNGLKTAIVTSSNRLSASKVLQVTGIIADCLITGDDVSRGKPDPEPVLRAVDCMGVTRSETAGVGDTIVDLKAYRAAGLRNIIYVRSEVPVDLSEVWELEAEVLESLCDLLERWRRGRDLNPRGE